MITGDIKNQIDNIWNDFWAGGVANPLSVIEQITYLLFIKRLDELHTLEERKSQRLNMALRRQVWNSPPELGQDMTSTTTGGMAWTAPRY